MKSNGVVLPLNHSNLWEQRFAVIASSDYLLASHIYSLLGDKVRYVRDLQSFFRYDITKGIWESENANAIFFKECNEISGEFKRRANGCANSNLKDIYEENNDWLGTTRNWKHLAEIASYSGLFDIKENAFDRQPHFLNLLNCTYDLTNMEARAHLATDFLREQCSVEFNPQANCPNWLTYLDQSLDGNEENLRFIQKAAGYSLSGNVDEQLFFALQGPTGSGKSTFVEILKDCTYSVTLNPNVIFSRQGPRPSTISKLKGRRMGYITEAESDYYIDEPTLKRLTGNDTISAEIKHRDPVDFQPTWKLWFSMNSHFKLNDPVGAIERRLRIIKFAKLKTSPDLKLREKLKAELPGILNWFIEGYKLYSRERLAETVDSRKEKELLRISQNPVFSFWTSMTEFKNQSKLSVRDAHGEFTKWCNQQNLQPGTVNAFSRKLQEYGEKSRKGEGGKMYFENRSLIKVGPPSATPPKKNYSTVELIQISDMDLIPETPEVEVIAANWGTE